MNERIITLDKAMPLSGEIPDTTIKIVGCLPSFKSLQLAEQHYKQQAELLEDTLSTSIAQGVVHQLLIRLLQHKECLYRGI